MGRLKNHILPKGQSLQKALKSKFGVTLSDFTEAVGGDLKAVEMIGELAKQGRLASELAPKLAQHYIDIIQGSEALNRATADILIQAGKSGIAIDKAISQTNLANIKYENQREELAAQIRLDRKAENIRHNYQMNYTEIKGYIDAHLVEVDQQAAYVEQSYRPELKQIAADEQFHQKQINEALAKGEEARYDLIPEKKYIGIRGKIAELKAALGF